MLDAFHSRFSRLLLALLLASATLWLGGTVVRAALGYDVFVPGTLDLKPTLDDAEKLATIRLFVSTAAYTGWAFGIAALCAIVLSIRERAAYAHRGWMLMIAILAWLLVPLQGWSVYHDYLLAQHFDMSTDTMMPLLSMPELLVVFRERIANVGLAMSNGLSVLIGFTIIILAAMRPLERS